MNKVTKTKISLREILSKTDVIMRENDIIYICDDMDIVKEFIARFKNGVEDTKEVKEFLIEHEESIDKEKFILLTVKNYKDNIELLEKKLLKYTNQFSTDNTTENFSRLANLHVQTHQQKENLERALKLCKGIEKVLTYYYYDETEKRYRVGVVDSRKVIDGKKTNLKSIKRFDEIDLNFKGGNPNEKYGLEYVLQSLLLTDLYHVFPDEQFGTQIRTMILENQVIELGIKSKAELESLKVLELYDDYVNTTEDLDFDALLPKVKETLREYAEYIDMDKLLITSAYRFCEALEEKSISESALLDVKELLKGIIENIKNKNTFISCDLQNKLANALELKQVKFDVNEIKKYLSQFVGNTYLTSKQIEKYREQINSGEIKLIDVPNEYVDVIFSNQELEQLSLLSPENLIYVLQKQNWDASKIIELYEEDYISLESVKKIKECIDLSNIVSLEKLNSYYKMNRQSTQNDETDINYKRYLELYKEIFINGKNEEEIKDISNQIMESMVETFEGNEYDKAIKEYLTLGLLKLEVIADWSNESFITELFNDGQISLEDIKGLVEKEKISFECLSNICKELINNEDMEYDERLKLIRSGYVKEDDIFELYKRNLIFESDLKQLADEKIIGSKETQRLINTRTMEELEKNSAIRLTGLNALTKKNNEIYVSSGGDTYSTEERRLTEKFIIDPNERERFLRLLKAYRANTDLNEDSPFYDYEFYVIPDESGTIGLNSVVIAERYYEDKDTETKFAINNATYFFKYKDLMVLSNLRKSEMTKERENIVFTANHVIASENREGSWAKSVLASIVKTMISCDLKEYSKKNQQIIVRQKLKQMYTTQELNEILEMAAEIDSGLYRGVIEEPVIPNKKRGRVKRISSDKDER